MKIDCDRSSQRFGANSTKAAKEIFADGINHMMKKDTVNRNFNAINMLLEDIYQHAPDLKIGGKYIDKDAGTAYLKMPVGDQDNLTKVNTHNSGNFLDVLKKFSYIIHNYIENSKLSVYSGKLPSSNKNLTELTGEEIVNSIMKKTVRMD